MSPWNECLANVPKACESVCCICVRGSFLFQWNCVQLRHGNLSTTTYRNRSSLRGTPKPFPTCPPVSIPKGGGRGGAPPYEGIICPMWPALLSTYVSNVWTHEVVYCFNLFFYYLFLFFSLLDNLKKHFWSYLRFSKAWKIKKTKKLRW